MPYYASLTSSETAKARKAALRTPMRDLFLKQQAPKANKAERQARDHAASVRIFGKKSSRLVVMKSAIEVFPVPTKRVSEKGMLGTFCELLGVGNRKDEKKEDEEDGLQKNGIKFEQVSELEEQFTVRKAGVKIVVSRPLRSVEEVTSLIERGVSVRPAPARSVREPVSLGERATVRHTPTRSVSQPVVKERAKTRPAPITSLEERASSKVTPAVEEPSCIKTPVSNKIQKKVLLAPLPDSILTPRLPLPPLLAIDSVQRQPPILKYDDSEKESEVPLPSQCQLKWEDIKQLLP